MLLTELIADGGDTAEPMLADQDIDIVGLASDSRAVHPGYLFAALPGAQVDGAKFIGDAIERGASAILAPPDIGRAQTAEGTSPPPFLLDINPRRRLALMAARFYGRQPDVVAAVTGTNGKTSVAVFTRQIWTRLGTPAASLGTVGVTAPGRDEYLPLTTLDPIELHRILAELAEAGVEHLALEASSHGLDQYRLDGVRIVAAGFTNLSRDHLDYHPTMADYLAAKARLVEELLPSTGCAVLNADAPEFRQLEGLCRTRGQHIMPYGRAADPEIGLRLDDLAARPDGLEITVTILGQNRSTRLPLVGEFQAMNALCALGLVISCGGDAQASWETLAEIEGAPGRLQHIAEGPKGGAIYVDYAHTPGALETVLTALRPHTEGRLIVVFGCGGDRDPGKRPLMGEAAARLADQAIVTDDNPRSEDPAAIRAAALAACPDAREIGDRAEAIAAGVAELGAQDILLIAGKGHERGQTVGDRVLPFDDAAVVRDIVADAGDGR